MQAYWVVLALAAWAIALALQFALRRPDRAGALVPAVVLCWTAVLAADLPQHPELAPMGASVFALASLLVAALGALAGAQGALDLRLLGGDRRAPR